MTKTELRKKYKALRSKLTNSTIQEKSLAIANLLLKLPIWDFSYYHIFLSIEKHKEINTEYILNILSGKDKNIVLSKCIYENTSLEHYLLTDNTTLKVSNYGIPEPVDGIPINENLLDVVFVPLLAFDELGNRVGYGKGFYDNFLSKCNNDAIKIGLSFFDAEKQTIKTHQNDIPLSYCITPEKIIKF